MPTGKRRLVLVAVALVLAALYYQSQQLAGARQDESPHNPRTEAKAPTGSQKAKDEPHHLGHTSAVVNATTKPPVALTSRPPTSIVFQSNAGAARKVPDFCPQFIQSFRKRREATSPGAWEIRPKLNTDCQARFKSLTDCQKIRSGVYARVLKCVERKNSVPTPVVLKIDHLHGHVPESNHQGTFKEVVAACQYALLRSANVSANFVRIFDFFHCRPGEVANFLRQDGIGQELTEQQRLRTTYLHATVIEWTQTATAAHPFPPGWITAQYLFELVYSVLSSYLTLGYSVADIQLEHMGWLNVTYARKYVLSQEVTYTVPAKFPMVQQIDFNAYRLMPVRWATAYDLLDAAQFFLILAADHKPCGWHYLNQQAKELYQWMKTGPFRRLPCLPAVLELARFMSKHHPSDTQQGEVREFTLPDRAAAKRIAGTWKNLTEFNFRVLKVWDPTIS
eukprot:TRINITY_DN3660_c0_g1_i1.p1 TRINITY_DN3660_c0_g1~~TRINITY_DN3660_c0_g1_i1.p1  ORF type:complete len:450 (-),score=70.99 TRINITY_DN3660_c0_g1_i1:2-1351(-)